MQSEFEEKLDFEKKFGKEPLDARDAQLWRAKRDGWVERSQVKNNGR